MAAPITVGGVRLGRRGVSQRGEGVCVWGGDMGVEDEGKGKGKGAGLR